MIRPDIDRERLEKEPWTANEADIPALLAAIDQLTAQRDAVLALHYEVNAHDCAECGDPWPCETVRALT